MGMTGKKIARGVAGAAAVLGVSAGLVVGFSTPAAAAGEWCNTESTEVCIRTTNSGLYHDVVEVSVWSQNQERTISGRIFNGKNSWPTKVERVGSFTTYRGYAKVDKVLGNQTQLCADGYFDNNRVGRSCVTVVA